MRLLELTRVAASSEALRLRLLMKRQITRVVLAAIGAVFALATLALLEAAAVTALVPPLGPLYAILVVALVNIVVAGILMWLASSGTPSAGEQQALQMRNQALASMRTAGVVMTAVQWGVRAARRRR